MANMHPRVYTPAVFTHRSPEPATRAPAGGLSGGYDDSYDRFDEPQPLRRRFAGREFDEAEPEDQDFYRPRRNPRAAIPEEAASRRRGRSEASSGWSGDSEQDRRMARFGNRDDEPSRSGPSFGDRRSQRDDQRRGSRPNPASTRSANPSPTAGRGSTPPTQQQKGSRPIGQSQAGIPQGTPLRQKAEDAAYTPSERSAPTPRRPAGPTAARPDSAERTPPRSSRPRDNSSRFDD